MSNQTAEQFEAIVKKFRESTLDKCSENELRQYHTFLLEHGAVGGFNETTYHQLCDYIRTILLHRENQNRVAVEITDSAKNNVFVGCTVNGGVEINKKAEGNKFIQTEINSREIPSITPNPTDKDSEKKTKNENIKWWAVFAVAVVTCIFGYPTFHQFIKQSTGTETQKEQGANKSPTVKNGSIVSAQGNVNIHIDTQQNDLSKSDYQVIKPIKKIAPTNILEYISPGNSIDKAKELFGAPDTKDKYDISESLA